MNVCAGNAECTNTDGSYICQCESGYSGDGSNFCNGETSHCFLHTSICVSQISMSAWMGLMVAEIIQSAPTLPVTTPVPAKQDTLEME